MEISSGEIGEITSKKTHEKSAKKSSTATTATNTAYQTSLGTASSSSTSGSSSRPLVISSGTGGGSGTVTQQVFPGTGYSLGGAPSAVSEGPKSCSLFGSPKLAKRTDAAKAKRNFGPQIGEVLGSACSQDIAPRVDTAHETTARAVLAPMAATVSKAL